MDNQKEKFVKLALPDTNSELARFNAAAKPAFDAMQEQMRAAKPAFDALQEQMRAAKPAFDAMQEHARAMSKRIQPLLGALNENSAMANVSRQIENQFKAIGALDRHRGIDAFQPTQFPDVEERVSVPELRILPNPVHETNKRLKRIQERFDRMEAIAVEAASIANSLQAFAATFLVKFEKAAADNDRATKRAIRIAILAAVIALITMTQTLYAEFWRAPLDAATSHAVIADMKKEIAELRHTQRVAGDQLSETIAQSNSNIYSTLKEIRELLAGQKQTD